MDSNDDEYVTKVERIIGEKTDLTRDLENWMSKLPASLRSLPIIYLAIPGSHDSFTANISFTSRVSPDVEKILRKLQWIVCAKLVIINWCKTQNLNVLEQLNSGIRFFDLRISTKTGTDKLYFCHGLYSCEILPVLEEIRNFLDLHPEEVVILDCQHFYGFNDTTHNKMMHLFVQIYGTKLVPYSNHIDHLSLNYMTSQFRYQIIVVYRSDAARFGQPLLWPGKCFHNPWADTMDPNKLFSFLDEALEDRNLQSGCVTQIILTPTISYILKNMTSSLKRKLAVNFEDQRTGWISNKIPGRNNKGVNIIMGDFVNLSDNLFTKTVINLNLKLLSDLPRPFSFKK